MSKAQDYINHHYPHQQRTNVKKLDLRNKSLERNLDLTSFYNLEELDISNNNINSGLDYLSTILVSIHCYNDKNNNLEVSIINEALKHDNFQISKWRQDHDANYVDFQVQLEEKEERIRELENQIKEYQETIVQFSEQLGQKEIRQAGTQTTKEEENQQTVQVEVLIPHSSS